MRVVPWFGSHVVTLIAATALCAGCGTTVAGVGANSTSAVGNGLSAPGSSSGSALVTGNAAAGTAGAGAPASGAAGGLGAATGAAGPGTGAGGGGSGLPSSVAFRHAGVTGSTLTIGVTYYGNASAANAAVGANGITSGNEPADAQAVAADVNRHGGIAGHQVKIELRQVDAQDTTAYAAQAQADCTYWTQDHQVFAALVDTSFRDLEGRCFEKAGVFLFGGDTIGIDDTSHLRFSLQPGAMDIVRMAQAEVATFSSANWYSPWDTATGAPGAAPVKTGILTFDSHVLHTLVDKYFVPGMRAAGHPPATTDIVYLAPPSSEGQDGTIVSQIQNAVLRFRQDQVTHVLITDSTASVTLIFANAAYGQRYFPRYGGSTGNGFQALLDGGDIQKQSLRGAVSAGWMPVLDLPFGSPASKAAMSAPAKHCLQVMRVTGQSYGDSSAAGTAYLYCDALYVLQAAAAGMTELTDQTLLARYEALGTRHETAIALVSDLAFNRHDGASGYRPVVYSNSCGCMAYSGSAGRV